MQGVLNQLQSELTETAMQLRLTPVQEYVWDVYQGRVSTLMSDLLRPAGTTIGSSNALQQIGTTVDVARDRLTALEDMADAATVLYASLDQRQRVVADRRLALTVPTRYSPPPGELAAANSGKDGRDEPGGQRGRGRMVGMDGTGSTPSM